MQRQLLCFQTAYGSSRLSCVETQTPLGSRHLFFPSIIWDILTDRFGCGPLPDHCFYNGTAHKTPKYSIIERFDMPYEEFDKAEAIIARANECEANGETDSRWNATVRMPLLKLCSRYRNPSNPKRCRQGSHHYRLTAILWPRLPRRVFRRKAEKCLWGCCLTTNACARIRREHWS